SLRLEADVWDLLHLAARLYAAASATNRRGSMNALLLDVWAALKQDHSVLGIFCAGEVKDDKPQPFTRTERGLVLGMGLGLTWLVTQAKVWAKGEAAGMLHPPQTSPA
ncbi:unnamed protein product, partial [Prorocentrum cordatum]